MPSTATITTFHVFTANTKAKASEVNTNYSNLRGNLVPTNVNTASSADLTWDIGSETKRWNVGYFGSVNVDGATTTNNAIFESNNTSTAGVSNIVLGSDTLASFSRTYARLYGDSVTSGYFEVSTARAELIVGGNTVTSMRNGAMDILSSGTTIASTDTNGWTRNSIAPYAATAAGSAVGQLVIVSVGGSTDNLSSAAQNLGGTLRIFRRIGSMQLGFQRFSVNVTNTQSNTIAVSHIFNLVMQRGQTTTALASQTSMKFTWDAVRDTTASGQTLSTTYVLPSIYQIDLGASVGENVYEFNVVGTTTNSPCAMSFTGEYICREI